MHAQILPTCLQTQRMFALIGRASETLTNESQLRFWYNILLLWQSSKRSMHIHHPTPPGGYFEIMPGKKRQRATELGLKRQRATEELGLTHLAEFIFYSISGSGKLP